MNNSLGYMQMCGKHGIIFPPKIYSPTGAYREIDLTEFIQIMSTGNGIEDNEFLKDDLSLEIGLRFVYLVNKYTK